MKIVGILEKTVEIHRFKKKFFLFCVSKMVDISAETFAKNSIHTITQVRKSKKLVLWIRIKDIAEKLDVKNIFDVVDKEIKGKFENYLRTTNYPLQNNKLESIRDMDQN